MAFEDRRKSRIPRQTITQILDRMQKIADEDHDGDLQNNSLIIFEKLPTDDKRTLLRKSLMLQWETQIDLARHGTQDIMIEQEGVHIKHVELERERDGLIQAHPDEAERFMRWAIRTGLGLFFMLVLTVAMTLIYTSRNVPANGDATSWVARMWRIIDVLF